MWSDFSLKNTFKYDINNLTLWRIILKVSTFGSFNLNIRICWFKSISQQIVTFNFGINTSLLKKKGSINSCIYFLHIFKQMINDIEFSEYSFFRNWLCLMRETDRQTDMRATFWDIEDVHMYCLKISGAKDSRFLAERVQKGILIVT